MQNKTCPKCGYERTGAEKTPEYECPRCGVIYAKYVPRSTPSQADRSVHVELPGDRLAGVAQVSGTARDTNFAAVRPDPVPAGDAVRHHGPDTVPFETEDTPVAQGQSLFAGMVDRTGMANRYLIGAIAVGLVVGYFGGREHLKYQIRSTIEDSAARLFRPSTDRTAAAPVKAQAKGSTTKVLVPTLVSKGFETGTYGRAEITFSISFKNETGRDIRAFDGLLTFTDLLDNEIHGAKLAVNDPVARGASLTWVGSLNYNQFMSEHERLKTAEQENMRVIFRINKVLFADGETKEYR